ncbi:MAG: cupin domain-containing protein [Bacteroidetes bacterium]|nr:cupin domain-containing protein [Bacteroidota bacterium]
MKYNFPHTITNCIGEKIVFHSITPDKQGDIVKLDAYCKPGAGPAMHTHLKQEEQLTVIAGKMGYQVLGQEVKFANPGETVKFERGTPHKFWAEGQETLHCEGLIQPANSIVFFLSSLYAAQNKSNQAEPDKFDGAYLLTKYASEYDMPEIPSFVKKLIFPLIYNVGNMLGKYKHFKDAPAPL